jgi:hypothetical protein
MAKSTRSLRPSDRSRRRRYTRLAVRGLVVAGFAGVAWLLSSSAAHASSTQPAAGGLTSLVNVLGGAAGDGPASSGAVLPTATGLLTHALPATATAVDGRERSIAMTRADGSRAGSGDKVDGAVRGLFASPVLQPVDAVLSPELTPGPATSGAPMGSATKKAKAATDRRGGTAARVRSGRAEPAKASGMADVVYSDSASAARTDSAGTDGNGIKLTGAEQDGTVGRNIAIVRGAASRHRAVGGGHSAEAGDPIDSRRTHHVPLLPRPAPAPVLPGAGLTSGVPSMGSGLNQDGGAPAIVPVATAAGTAARNRPDRADDVDVQALIAESPTISPD